MKALCWMGKNNVKVNNVPEPKIEAPRDALIKVTSTAICGSDLHLLNGMVPTMKSGDILGHEFMGEIIELGGAVGNLNVGDRVVIPFTIACGSCYFCSRNLWSLCDNSNPNSDLSEQTLGFVGSGLFGYSHLYGGYSGGQAEFVRVPFADVGALKVPDQLGDEQVLFLSDILPTGYMAASNCNIHPGDTVAIWGAGPVGLMAIKSAFLLGAERVIAIDRVEARLRLASENSNAEVLDRRNVDVLKTLKEMTGGRGPDSCIDAVGLEEMGCGVVSNIDWLKTSVGLATDRPQVLRECIYACRKGGTVSVPGVYVGLVDKLPFGIAFAKGLTMRMGQTHVQSYLPQLLDHIIRGDIDTRFIITQRIKLEEAAEAYHQFNRNKDEYIKVVMTPI